MKNYICLNGQNIELTEEQVAEIKKSLGTGQVRLKDIPIEETFKIGDYELIVLSSEENRTVVLLKDLFRDEERFGENNNYENSNADKICNQFAQELAAIIGEENIYEHTVDLTSDDGLKDYGEVKRKASLLTTELYRKYVNILDKHKLKAYWWLATAYSTPTHENANWIKCVSPGGFININDYYHNIGVRPFCILNSNIFVSR